MSLHPDKLPLIHAFVDGELDAANALAIEAHIRACADCRAELERIESVRDLLAAARLGDTAPAGLRDRIDAMLDAQAGAAPRLPAQRSGVVAHVLSGRWASGAVTGALAASLALALVVPQVTHADTEDQIVQSHVRSLLVGHVVDIPTSDRHVVKPWFNGKIDFAPSVPDLAADGFPLVGGRLDYLDDHAVAAIVYRRRLHTINLFVRPARALSLPVAITAHHEGYTLLRWTAAGLEYWAVSDLDARDLTLFRQTYEKRTQQ
jgi:anti-sigma factor RsiW